MSAVKLMHEQKMMLRNISHELNQDIFEYLKLANFGELHFCNDNATGLQTIVAIHSTKRGPALGGCRFIEYPSTFHALWDVTRLAQAMSYKAAIAGLKLGGGKSVVLKSKHINNREALFTSYAKFVETLNGRYITALDSGSTEDDMNIIAQYTRYVSSNSQPGGASGNPAPYTAHGVLAGIQAAVKFKLKRDNLKGIHVLLQGVGQVGYALAQLLSQAGAQLTICDVNNAAVDRCVTEFQATAVDYHAALDQSYDVFAPCALGGVINSETINQLQAPIVAGAANNQLEHAKYGQQLFEKDILWAPDYLINAGGLIYAASLYFKQSEQETLAQIDQIYERVTEVFKRSAQEAKPTNEIVDTMAEELLK